MSETHECEHRYCEQPTAPGDRFCRRHREELGLVLATIEIRCPTCGKAAPKGLMWHDCDDPSPEPPEAEQL